MVMDKASLSGGQGGQSDLLKSLCEELIYGKMSSKRRVAAFRLSWLQDDGLNVLKEVFFGDFSLGVKTAAAYGLRKMRGRMKKEALVVFREGLTHPDRLTRQVSREAMKMLGQFDTENTHRDKDEPKSGIPIKEIDTKKRQQGNVVEKPKTPGKNGKSPNSSRN